MDRIVSSSHDRTSLLSTHKVLRNTYFLLSLTLGWPFRRLPQLPVRC